MQKVRRCDLIPSQPHLMRMRGRQYVAMRFFFIVVLLVQHIVYNRASCNRKTVSGLKRSISLAPLILAAAFELGGDPGPTLNAPWHDAGGLLGNCRQTNAANT